MKSINKKVILFLVSTILLNTYGEPVTQTTASSKPAVPDKAAVEKAAAENKAEAKARAVNTKLKLGLGTDEPKMAFLVGFIERNYESYFNNPYQNVNAISGFLVGDPRCMETTSGCGVCNTYAPNGSKANTLRYRLCQWGYNINWPFQYGGTNWGMNGRSQEYNPGGNLINDISAFPNTNYLVTKEMWGKAPDTRFNVPLPASTIANAGGCPDDDMSRSGQWYCANKYIRNSQANIMSCLKGNNINLDFTTCTTNFNYGKEQSHYIFNCACQASFPGTGPDITPEQIKQYFP